MKGYKFVIPGKPYPSPRPRATTRGKFASVYMPKQYMDHKEWMQGFMLPLHLKGTILISLEFYFEMPKSWSKTKKEKMMGSYHCQRPDWDNLAKTAMDAMNKLVYEDDGQSALGTVKKIWSDEAKTIIKVIELEEE